MFTVRLHQFLEKKEDDFIHKLAFQKSEFELGDVPEELKPFICGYCKADASEPEYIVRLEEEVCGLCQVPCCRECIGDRVCDECKEPVCLVCECDRENGYSGGRRSMAFYCETCYSGMEFDFRGRRRAVEPRPVEEDAASVETVELPPKRAVVIDLTSDSEDSLPSTKKPKLI